jgi:hypothetical protein
LERSLELFQASFFGGFHVGRSAAATILVSLAFLLLFGCSWGQTAAPFMETGSWTSNLPPTDGSPGAALGVLNWTAGVSILGGMASLLLTRSRTAWGPIVGGCCLIILSYAIAAYSHYVILPACIVITTVSAVWGYKTVVKAWRTR